MRLDQNVRIGWIGAHMEGIPALQALLAMGIPLTAVITLAQEELAGRSGAVDYAGVLRDAPVPLYRVRNINDDASIALLRELALDIAFVIGWSQILKAEALATARIGMIGAHASLLPRHRGSAPINWALIRGERCTGNSLIWLEPAVDAGDLIDQIEFPITLYDTCATLYEKVARSNREMIQRLLPKLLAGERPGRAQRPTEEPLLPRRRPADGRIEWRQEARAVYDFVRALTRPYPGAFSWLDGERWLIWNCALLPDTGGKSDAPPGRTLGPVSSPVDAACGQLVSCGCGTVLLLEVENSTGQILRGKTLSEQSWKGKLWSNE
jgi:methionyl-tRNA formyltransferase